MTIKLDPIVVPDVPAHTSTPTVTVLDATVNLADRTIRFNRSTVVRDDKGAIDPAYAEVLDVCVTDIATLASLVPTFKTLPDDLEKALDLLGPKLPPDLVKRIK